MLGVFCLFVNVYRLTFRVVPCEDVALPAVTSRVPKQIFVRSLLESGSEKLRRIADLFRVGSDLVRLPVKPVRVSFLYCKRGGEVSYLWCEYDARPVIRSGQSYYFDVVLFESDASCERSGVSISADVVVELMERLSGEFKIFQYNTVEVQFSELHVVSEEDLEVSEDYDTVIVEFKTPTLLQYPKHPRLRNYPSRHSLYPQPMLVVLSLVYKWNSLNKRNYVSLAHVLYAPYEIIEVSHSIKPVTIQFRKLRERGFVGWIKYGIDSRSEKRFRTYLKLFKFAQYSGIGRSTSIGLGEVSVRFSKRSSD